MPFDVDLAPLTLDGSDDDVALLRQAVDQAFLRAAAKQPRLLDRRGAWLPRPTDRRPRKHKHSKAWAGSIQRWQDAGGFPAKAAQLIRRSLRPPWRLLRPRLARGLSEFDERSSSSTSYRRRTGRTRCATSRACSARSALRLPARRRSRRRIIHAIWDDLCRANVVSSISPVPNLNVMMNSAWRTPSSHPVPRGAARRRGRCAAQNVKSLRSRATISRAS